METNRLFFSEWLETDFAMALKLWGNPNVTRYISATSILSKDNIKDRLQLEISNGEKHAIQYWPVFLKSDGAFVGCCGLRPYDSERGILEIGFHICEHYWGNGYAKEAALKVISYPFSVLSANALFAGHHPENTNSKHLLQRLGFQYTHKELYPPTELYHPSYLLTLHAFNDSK
ncbi:GNAT family N-acetyltransferase [Pontibacter silvestris]|uniref:GNAT family N-acetyltransferase n=2 Tax=Pontibacter silvestris TaxID=2305183 RepID=A0ABW4WY90_9BACT